MRIALCFLTLSLGCGVAGGGAVDAMVAEDVAIADVGVDHEQDAPVDSAAVVARMLPLGDAHGLSAMLSTPGQRDRYRIDVRAGTWIQIRTQANVADATDYLDTVLRVYDNEGELLGQNDDRLPRINSDSELVLRVPGQGMTALFVEVLDFYDFAGRVPRARADWQYQIFAIGMTALREGIVASHQTQGTLEGDEGVVLMNREFSVADFRADFRQRLAGAMLDVIALDMLNPYEIGMALEVRQATTLARSSVVADLRVSPYVVGADPTLHIDSAARDRAFRYRIQTDFAGELDEIGNNSRAQAELIDLGTSRSGGFVLLMGDGDVDWLQLSLEQGGQARLVCDAANRGSGVRNVALIVENAAHTQLLTATLSNDAVSDIDFPVAIGSTWLRFAKGAQDSQVAGNWLRCGLRVR